MSLFSILPVRQVFIWPIIIIFQSLQKILVGTAKKLCIESSDNRLFEKLFVSIRCSQKLMDFLHLERMQLFNCFRYFSFTSDTETWCLCFKHLASCNVDKECASKATVLQYHIWITVTQQNATNHILWWECVSNESLLMTRFGICHRY